MLEKVARSLVGYEELSDDCGTSRKYLNILECFLSLQNIRSDDTWIDMSMIYRSMCRPGDESELISYQHRTLNILSLIYSSHFYNKNMVTQVLVLNLHNRYTTFPNVENSTNFTKFPKMSRKLLIPSRSNQNSSK